jgi:AcrR family transcriptional regulator
MGVAVVAYEVTKRIKGHDYRYTVEAYRDPVTQSRKTRWRYIGAVEGGVVRPATPRALQKRVTREQIVAAATKLLSFRDPEHITVAVIAAAAGASRSAFYRHFHSEHEALSSALASMIDELIRDLPPLAQPQNLEEARGLLRSWCEAFAQSIEQHAALKRALRQDRSGRQRVRFDLSCATQSAAEILSEFFRSRLLARSRACM